MARIAGVNIPTNKRVIVALTYIHGIGPTKARAIANKLGIEFRVPLEKRIAGAEKVGKHKTSMLQDVEAGRAPEIDALVGSVAELARLTETPTPHIDTVYALVKLLARGMEEGSTGVRMQSAA